MMRQIQLNSPEFKRVMKNLQLENLHLSDTLQKKALEIVNSELVVIPDFIKKTLANSEKK